MAVDKYPSVLYDVVTESAANVITFEEVNVGLNMFDKIGLLIARIEYSDWMLQIVADGDSLEWGLTASNQLTSLDPANSSMIDYNRVSMNAVGTPAIAIERVEPYIKDFSTLPGGGLLITPKPLYLVVDGSNLTNPARCKMRMFFTIVKLQPAEYFELLEARQFFG